MKMKVGIIFGGISREREISFAGGRTVYDNLNKNLFEPVPVFVDSLGNFILLDWQLLYKGTIRDFYPPISFLPPSPNGFQIYAESLPELSDNQLDEMISQVGRHIQPHEFSGLFELAFLALHGPYGEDGSIQGLLEWYGIPYSGAGILPSAISIDKAVHQTLFANAGLLRPDRLLLTRQAWKKTEFAGDVLEDISHQIGLPFVIKPPRQGSSMGIAVINRKDNLVFAEAVDKAFFMQKVTAGFWKNLDIPGKIQFIHDLTDIRSGIGLPVWAEEEKIHHPEDLLIFLDEMLSKKPFVRLASVDGEEQILLESFIAGKEFSCIVIEDEAGKPLALPPTEVRKSQTVFDYRSKYLPGMSRKITPIDIPAPHIEAIRQACCHLFEAMFGEVYARIDGFINPQGEVFLNDPNTTSGMMPSSFFFHQAAEIGLNPSQFLTYIIRTSLAARIRNGKNNSYLRNRLVWLDEQIMHLHSRQEEKIRVAVIMGGFSSERHISVESGRNIYEKLSSSARYQPIPVFLTGNEHEHQLFLIPVNIMLKDNADDIREKLLSRQSPNPVLAHIREQAQHLTQHYTGGVAQTKVRQISYAELATLADEVFIALHGRPGEDGAVQVELEKYKIPYNGSGIESSRLTINKFDTNEKLRHHGILTAEHALVFEKDWTTNPEAMLHQVESQFAYPFIAKPADDGCSSAVKKIKNRAELKAFAEMIFRKGEPFIPEAAEVLYLKTNEEFPQKAYFLVEELIVQKDARHFLEVTGGLLTHFDENGGLQYEIFEPSEALASGEILSLEEKFLAGEGQNITPARYARNPAEQAKISAQVRAELERVARVLEVQGYCRIDAFVRIYDENRVEVIIIEVNSLPGMTPATCIFHQAALNGYKPYHYIDKILEFGRRRFEV
jgi:UDP-N-acetylmuramate--alanine ligase